MSSQIPSDAIRVMPDPLRAMAAEIFRRLDLPDADAKRIADCLVQVDLRGVFSHGTRQLRRYAQEYRTGGLNPRPEIRLIRETPVTALFDGDGGIGYLVATRATEAVIQKAETQGIAIAGARNHGHVGSEGIYARMALRHTLITFAVAGGTRWQPPAEPDATVWDAMRAPPMCFGIPSEDGPPLVLDMNVNMFKGRSRVEEAMCNFSDPVFKSLGLRFVSTLLGGVLAGDVPPDERTDAFPAARRGFLIVAFRPDAVGDVGNFTQEVARIITASRALNPIAGQETAEVPGSLEWQREQDWAREGIPLGADHRKLVEEIAHSLSVDTPWRSKDA